MHFTALFGAMAFEDVRGCTNHPWHSQLVNDLTEMGATSLGVSCAASMAREPRQLLHDSSLRDLFLGADIEELRAVALSASGS
eukprot:765707-Pyramimonas_sp.AAC.1